LLGLSRENTTSREAEYQSEEVKYPSEWEDYHRGEEFKHQGEHCEYQRRNWSTGQDSSEEVRRNTRVRKASVMDPKTEPPLKPTAVKITREDSCTWRQEKPLEPPKANQASQLYTDPLDAEGKGKEDRDQDRDRDLKAVKADDAATPIWLWHDVI
jgi:hypothetical protein